MKIVIRFTYKERESEAGCGSFAVPSFHPRPSLTGEGKDTC
jgi:hypothetical protein